MPMPVQGPKTILLYFKMVFLLQPIHQHSEPFWRTGDYICLLPVVFTQAHMTPGSVLMAVRDIVLIMWLCHKTGPLAAQHPRYSLILTWPICRMIIELLQYSFNGPSIERYRTPHHYSANIGVELTINTVRMWSAPLLRSKLYHGILMLRLNPLRLLNDCTVRSNKRVVISTLFINRTSILNYGNFVLKS